MKRFTLIEAKRGTKSVKNGDKSCGIQRKGVSHEIERAAYLIRRMNEGDESVPGCVLLSNFIEQLVCRAKTLAFGVHVEKCCLEKWVRFESMFDEMGMNCSAFSQCKASCAGFHHGN